jgi:hypothetical protein
MTTSHRRARRIEEGKSTISNRKKRLERSELSDRGHADSKRIGRKKKGRVV